MVQRYSNDNMTAEQLPEHTFCSPLVLRELLSSMQGLVNQVLKKLQLFVLALALT